MAKKILVFVFLILSLSTYGQNILVLNYQDLIVLLLLVDVAILNQKRSV